MTKNTISPTNSGRPATTITTSTLREICSAGIADLVIEGQPGGGFQVRVRYGSPEQSTYRWLGTSRGGTRRFGSLDTAATLLLRLNVREFRVNVTDYEPGRIRAPRPDRAEALRRTRSSPPAAPHGVREEAAST